MLISQRDIGYNTRMKNACSQKSFRPTWRSAALLIVLAALYYVIFSFSAQSAETSSGVSGRIAQLFANPDSPHFAAIDHIVRKLAHAGEFAVLYLIWHLLLADAFPAMRLAARLLLPLLLVALSATADELSQMLSPGRACRLTDVLIDLAGASAMGLIVLAANARRASMRANPARGRRRTP